MGEGEHKKCPSCLAQNPAGATKCEKCGFPFIGKQFEEPSALEVGETFTYTGDRPFKGRIQVVALGFPQSRYLNLRLFCGGTKEICDQCILHTSNLRLVFERERIDPSAFATYFDTNNPRDALRILTERGVEPLCSAWWKWAQAKGEDERAVTQAIVMDRQGVEGRAWFVHGPKCDLKRAPNWIVADGWLCKGRKGRIGVLVQAFTPESEVTMPSREEVEKAREVLRVRSNPNSEELRESVAWKTAVVLKRRSQLKGEEVVKGYTSDVLTVASPVWVKTLEGEPQLGATTCEMGPTTTAKSQRIREIVKWLEAGKYDTGKKTPAGLTAGAEKVEGIGWIARKGLLPSADLSFLAIDNMPPHGLDEQIEARRNGVVVVTTIKQAELWARCRLKLLSNPATPFDETMQKCVALRVFDPKLVARFTFANFTYGVSVEERYDPTVVSISPEEEALLDAAKTVLRWNLSVETTFTVSDELWPLIMEYGQTLEETYGNEDIPLLVRANPYKLSVLAYAFSLLEGSEQPTERHVTLAYKWLDFCAKDIELDEYTSLWRKQHELSDEEYASLEGEVEERIIQEAQEYGGSAEETTFYKLIEYVARHDESHRDEIAAYLDVDPKTVTQRVNVLKGLQLLRSDKAGYHFTAKGVRFFKHWFKERMTPLGGDALEKLHKIMLKHEELGVLLLRSECERAGLSWASVLRAMPQLEREGKVLRTKDTVKIGPKWMRRR